MLQARNISSGLENALKVSELLGVALISRDGTVVESRERSPDQSSLFPQTVEKNDGCYTIEAKMQTKVYAIFMAEIWLQSPEAVWTGAEVHGRRLVLHEIKGSEFLLLIISDPTSPWVTLSEAAHSTTNNITHGV